MGFKRIGHKLMVMAAMLSAAGGIAPPLLRGAVEESSQTSGATFTPTLPAHQAGDWILVIVSASSNGGPILSVNAGGFTEEGEVEATGGQRVTIAVYSKEATGSSESLVLNNSGVGRIVAHAYVIRNATDVEAGFVINTSDPPSLTASWGNLPNLWFAAVAGRADEIAPSYTDPPSGFESLTMTTVGSGEGIVGLASAFMMDATATLNPGDFTGSSNRECAATIALKPVPD